MEILVLKERLNGIFDDIETLNGLLRHSISLETMGLLHF